MNAERLVLLGGSGDLAGRYLLPALADLAGADHLPESFELVGVARHEWDDAQFREFAAERLGRHVPDLDDGARAALLDRLRYVQGDADDVEALEKAIGDAAGPVVAYLALPPSLFASVIEALAATGLPDGSRIVVEKPFGTDLASARELNELLDRHFDETDVFRIDHFLGMQTVQNVLGLRFANRVFEPLWCAEHVESIDLVWEETVALEGRAGYYDHVGALRDMIQNHLLQLLSFVAMERPESLEATPLRDRKVEVLRSVATPDDTSVRERTVRGRYSAGSVGSREVPDYTAEEGVDPERATETFAEVVLEIDDDRWRGVPFRLRTGKAMAEDRREIVVRFRPVPDEPFGATDRPDPNVLTLTMDPDGLALDIVLNGAGDDPARLDPARVDLELAPQELSAYARLLLDAIDGDPALSTRGDEAEECWRIVEPILDAWARDVVPLATYEAGTSGLG